MKIKADAVLDAKGLACPMPIVKTKKTLTTLEGGQVLEVQATDKGSTADLKAWAESTGHQYLGTVEEGDALKHFVRKASGEETLEKKFERVTGNAELQEKIESGEEIVVLDVREEAEYFFKHIPTAVSIPLGELEARMNELDKEKDIFVVCRTGSRSDFASQKLEAAGFQKVTNVVPGMSGWEGKTESN
ncbi:hypothetical protein GKZ89_11195 [Bacillus mangrovi]|uniref:Rhodanese domain-containing protein n=1 Tax=Metabacillus mangrovi TaxID=1491830 RepID=A0A7X2S5G0_9BACI|nr:sulfurtransferase TusA family protein [Metabacillus mangrovi]MTH53972.1 hypothetical protein [Metabacillus mangrovi]